LIWVRSLLLCEDVRFELGGTLTLVGVHSDRITLEPITDEILVPRLALFAVVAGLTGVSEIQWRQTIVEVETGVAVLVADDLREERDPSRDEHRFVHLAGPIALPRAGRYRFSIEVTTPGARHEATHELVIETIAAT
jgi:hypothetical protein